MTGPKDPENEAPRQPETETDQWKFPSWRRVGDFVSNVFQLERNVASLKEDNKRLREELRAVQRQVNEQEGQLKVLLTFVQAALHEQVETRAEKAATRAIERLIAFQGNEKPED